MIMEKKTNRPADRIRELAQFYVSHKVFRGVKTFEAVCGLSKFYVKNISATTHGNPGVDIIAKIYKTFPGVSLYWLVLGEGEMLTVSEDEAVRAARDACAGYNKESKINSILNNKILKDMSREEKLDFVDKLLNGQK